MDLHSGVPLWQAIGEPSLSFAAARGDLACEVAVIGGGITGALVGFLLARSGVETVLVDKHTPGEGSTAASTGLLQYEVDTPLVDLIGKVGREHAVQAYARGLTAIDELEQLVADVGGGCGFSRRDSLYFASRRWHRRRLKQEYECRKEHGFDVRLLSRQELAERSSISAAGAIHSQGDGQLNPYAFTQRLLDHAQKRGLRIFGQTEVGAVVETPSAVILTAAEARITAKAVIYATGYQAHKDLQAAQANLQSTYVVASAPLDALPGWPDGCLLWETARPYFYARQTDDGRVIIGGADTAFAEDHLREDLLKRKSRLLQRRFEKLFPEIPFQAEYTWAGTFAETKDGLAHIGRLPGRTKVYAALGYGGNGITFSAIAAKLLVDLYLGRPNADAAVFSFER